MGIAPDSPAPLALTEQLRRDVRLLAGDIGVRNLFTGDSLARAAAYVAGELAAAGYQVQRQSCAVHGLEAANLIAELRGGRRAREIVIVGAHYDTVRTTPGANDNASGVAAMLTLARLFRGQKPDCTLRFVAFVNEEPPFFQTDLMGSRVYARECRKRGDRIVAMLCLETIGYFTDAPRSQHYPPVVGWFFPSQGNFIAFVGNWTSRHLVRRAARAFRQHADFPCESASLPGGLEGVGWSDHWSFWQEGYLGVMVTDTAPFRYPWYHWPEDTPDKLDYERLARVVEGLTGVVEGLSGAGGTKK